MDNAPFKSHWRTCQMSYDHSYSRQRISFETRLLSEIHSFLRVEPLLSPLDGDSSTSGGSSKRFLEFGQSTQVKDIICGGYEVDEDVDTENEHRISTVKDILKEMTFLPLQLDGLSDDDDELSISNVCEDVEQEVTGMGRASPDICTHHLMSMPLLSSLASDDLPVKEIRRRTTIEVIPAEDDEILSTDYENLENRLRSSLEKYESLRNSRGQHVRKREQNVRTLDDSTLRLLQEVSRGFNFKLNQIVESHFNKKLDPKTFIPEELLTGVLVQLHQEAGQEPSSSRKKSKKCRKGSVTSSSSSSIVSNASGLSTTRYSLTHQKSKLLRIDHSIADSIQVYREVMKPAIDRADSIQEVIRLRKELKEKEAALGLSKRSKSIKSSRRSSMKSRSSALPSLAESVSLSELATTSNAASTTSSSTPRVYSVDTILRRFRKCRESGGSRTGSVSYINYVDNLKSRSSRSCRSGSSSGYSSSSLLSPVTPTTRSKMLDKVWNWDNYEQRSRPVTPPTPLHLFDQETPQNSPAASPEASGAEPASDEHQTSIEQVSAQGNHSGRKIVCDPVSQVGVMEFQPLDFDSLMFDPDENSDEDNKRAIEQMANTHQVEVFSQSLNYV